MADETTDILMDETEDYSFEPEANDGLIPTEIVEEESEFLDPDDEETIDESEASVAAPSTTSEIEDPANIALPLPTGMDITTYTSYEDDTPDNVGTPGEEPEDIPEPSGEVVILRNKLKTVTTTYNEPIPGAITSEIITKINELNARVYAVLDDGTRVQCEVTDVFVPDGPPTVQYVNQGTVIASAINQHFWHDNEGAHVTDDSQDDWTTEYAKTDHGELANPTLNRPWHNILMNSYGFLIRKGLLWLSQQSVGATLFYDGSGNTVNNVVAGFTTGEVQIGKLTDKHLIIDTDGLHAYDENGNDASITARLAGSYIEDSTITGSKIADSTITGSKIVGSTLTDIPYAEIDALKARNISADAIFTATAFIAALSAASISASDISADHATIGSLNTNYAHISNGVIDNAKIGHADVNGLSANYAEINMANVNNAWLQNGTIKDAAISDGMINSVSANKLTAGTIDASNITVTNLNADNITAGTLNGQRIGDGSLSLNKLADDVYTETEVDGIVQNLQTQIDGAIETWTGTTIPTLQNSPASNWTTDSIKDTHVGDVYFVVNQNSDQNGYNYRFTKINNTYSWQLIKDNDVTQALQRLSTAEGSITQFSSDISQLQTETGQLRTRTTELQTSLGDKVGITEFNNLVNTVEENSSSIVTLTETSQSVENDITALKTKYVDASGTIIEFDDIIGIKNITIFGNSIQSDVPSPSVPVDIQDVSTIQLAMYDLDSSDTETIDIDLQGHRLMKIGNCCDKLMLPYDSIADDIYETHHVIIQKSIIEFTVSEADWVKNGDVYTTTVTESTGVLDTMQCMASCFVGVETVSSTSDLSNNEVALINETNTLAAVTSSFSDVTAFKNALGDESIRVVSDNSIDILLTVADDDSTIQDAEGVSF